MELELLKAKRQGDKGKSVMQEEETPPTLTTKQRLEKEIEEDRETWLDRVNFHLDKFLQKPSGTIKSLGTWLTITGPRTRFAT